MTKLTGNLRRMAGFTLIEVMVALVIVAISLTAISVTLGSMLNNATAMRDRTYASWVAQNKIVEMRSAGTAPKVGSTSGEVVFASADWAWRAVVAETGIESLWRVDVSVSFPGSEDNIRTVTGFIGEPPQPGQANNVWVSGIRRGDGGDGQDGDENELVER